MGKNTLKIIAFFIIGMVGGIFADQIFWPYFIERPLFNKYRLEQAPIYVTEKKEVTNYIQENTALKEAVAKVEKVVAGVKTKAENDLVLEGSGLVLTADGFIVTLADLVPQGSAFAFYVNEKWPAYQILKRDLKENLALIKVEDGKSQSSGFADLEKLKLGERVFLVGFDFSASTPQRVVNEGVIKSFNKDAIQTSIIESSHMAGSPLFNIEGNVVGLAVVDGEGRVSAIPISKIRLFTGF